MKPLYSDEQMYLIDIDLPCPDCREGIVEYQVPVVNSEGKDYGIEEVECDSCGGSGVQYITETYTSIEEAQEDYPDALSWSIMRRK